MESRPPDMLRSVPLEPPDNPLAVLPAASATSLDSIFRRYSSYVAAVALRLLGRDGEIDDVVQEVFLRAIRGLGDLREPGAAKSWLATVTVRVVRQRLRRRRLWSWLGVGGTHDYEEVAAPGASPEQRALVSQVYSVLDRLPAGQRVAWSLRYIEGVSLEEIGSLCGCSLATAKRRIAAARRTIEEAIR